MKFATRTSLIGLLSMAALIAGSHFFILYQRSATPEASIPIASLTIFAFIAGSVCLFINLQGDMRFDELSRESKIFLGGFGATVLLIFVACFGLQNELHEFGELALSDPYGILSKKGHEAYIALAAAHWWVHVVLGLALLIAVTTSITMFVVTDIAAALHASIAGPLYGLAVVLAASLFFMVAVGIAMAGALVIAAIAKALTD